MNILTTSLQCSLLTSLFPLGTDSGNLQKGTSKTSFYWCSIILSGPDYYPLKLSNYCPFDRLLIAGAQ